MSGRGRGLGVTFTMFRTRNEPDDLGAVARTASELISRAESIWPLLSMRDNDVAERARAQPGELNHE